MSLIMSTAPKQQFIFEHLELYILAPFPTPRWDDGNSKRCGNGDQESVSVEEEKVGVTLLVRSSNWILSSM